MGYRSNLQKDKKMRIENFENLEFFDLVDNLDLQMALDDIEHTMCGLDDDEQFRIGCFMEDLAFIYRLPIKGENTLVNIANSTSHWRYQYVARVIAFMIYRGCEFENWDDIIVGLEVTPQEYLQIYSR